MKRSSLMLAFLVMAGLLLFPIGCQEQARDVQQPKTAPLEPEPVLAPEPPAPRPARKPRVTRPKPVKPGPKLTFRSLTHDFGEIGPRTKNACEFKFKNTGDSLLKIERVTKTCGCTASALDKKEYMPGESGAVKVTYSAGSMPGAGTKRLYVNSNDKAQPRIALTVKAKVVLKVRHQPEKLNLVLKDENAGCPEITLTSVDDRPFAIKSFRARDNCITASFDPSVRQTKFVLTPKVDTEKLRRNLRGFVRIGLTHPQCNMINISFNVLPRFKVTPASIIIREAEPTKPVRREVWVLNNYGENFEIESTSVKGGLIKVLSNEKIDNRYKFVLQVTPPDAERKRFFTDTFCVNIKDGEKLEINCRGFYPVKRTKRPR